MRWIAIVVCAASLVMACDDENGQGTRDTGTSGEDTRGQDIAPNADRDGDGLTEEIEALWGTSPTNPDTDGDGLCDGGLTVVGVCIAGEDRNGNGSLDAGETDPTKLDTDGDGVPDGEEVTSGCTSADNQCISDERRKVCKEDGGEVVVEACPSGEICYEGSCGPIVCEAGLVEGCEDDGKYRGCNAKGTGSGVFDCPGSQVCVEGACIPRVCSVGDSVCQDDNQVMVCNALGTGFVEGSRCKDEDIKRVCDEGECKPICDVALKLSSYVGCDYWAVDLDNAIDGPYDAAGQQFAVVVSNATGEAPALVKVYEKRGFEEVNPRPMLEVEVPVGGLEILRLPVDCYPDGVGCEPTDHTPYDINGTTLGPHAYRIASDVPITAYQFNPLDNVEVFSNDASILFPSTSLGRRYLVMSRRQGFDTLRGFLTVVATQQGETRVEVTVKAKTLPGIDAQGNPIPSLEAGETRTFTLQPFDVLNLETHSIGGDLTGSFISADADIAVFGGSEAVDVPDALVQCVSGAETRTQAADHLEQQLYPINAWGVRYHAIKSFKRGKERDFWRVMARFDNTVVRTFPDQTDGPVTLNTGEFFEFNSTEDFEIEANKQILVGQFLAGIQDPIDPERCSSGPDSAGIGDPTFILGVPVEQYRSDYVFLVPRFYERDYITVVSPKDATVTLDGTDIDEAEFALFGEGEYKTAKLLVEDGVHTITTSAPSAVFVYGFDGSVSYGYPAGLNLLDLFQ